MSRSGREVKELERGEKSAQKVRKLSSSITGVLEFYLLKLFFLSRNCLWSWSLNSLKYNCMEICSFHPLWWFLHKELMQGGGWKGGRERGLCGTPWCFQASLCAHGSLVLQYPITSQSRAASAFSPVPGRANQTSYHLYNITLLLVWMRIKFEGMYCDSVSQWAFYCSLPLMFNTFSNCLFWLSGSQFTYMFGSEMSD